MNGIQHKMFSEVFINCRDTETTEYSWSRGNRTENKAQIKKRSILSTEQHDFAYLATTRFSEGKKEEA